MTNEQYPYTILFIEDETKLRENYVQYLKRYFKNVYEAQDGEEAYTIYKEKKPDILIVDINIPKLNGLDLLKKIRENDYVTKAIVLTAHSDVDFLLQATSLKLTKYLVKPITRQELHEALDLVLQEFSKFDTVEKEILQLKDDYCFNLKEQVLFHLKNPVILTKKERIFFVLLSSDSKKTFTYNEIVINLWDDIYHNSDRISSLKTIVKNLRKKLPKDTIKNIFGTGYKLEIN